MVQKSSKNENRVEFRRDTHSHSSLKVKIENTRKAGKSRKNKMFLRATQHRGIQLDSPQKLPTQIEKKKSADRKQIFAAVRAPVPLQHMMGGVCWVGGSVGGGVGGCVGRVRFESGGEFSCLWKVALFFSLVQYLVFSAIAACSRAVRVRINASVCCGTYCCTDVAHCRRVGWWVDGLVDGWVYRVVGW